MILRHRSFRRPPPSKDATSIYIFCEGVKREFQYFDNFRGLDSRINIEIYNLNPNEDNSPLGLLEIAKSSFGLNTDSKPKFELIPGDQVWLVFDTDPDKGNTRLPQINEIKSYAEKKGWNLAISNPCFEVWLAFHFYDKPPVDSLSCSEWKTSMNHFGGFDSRQHFVMIERAVDRSRISYSQDELELPMPGSTNVFNLGDVLVQFIGKKLEMIKNRHLEE